jgi:hypothetical protein
MGSRPWGGDRGRTDRCSFVTRTNARSGPGIVFGERVRPERTYHRRVRWSKQGSFLRLRSGVVAIALHAGLGRPSRGSADTLRGFG